MLISNVHLCTLSILAELAEEAIFETCEKNKFKSGTRSFTRTPERYHLIKNCKDVQHTQTFIRGYNNCQKKMLRNLFCFRFFRELLLLVSIFLNYLLNSKLQSADVNCHCPFNNIISLTQKRVNPSSISLKVTVMSKQYEIWLTEVVGGKYVRFACQQTSQPARLLIVWRIAGRKICWIWVGEE